MKVKLLLIALAARATTAWTAAWTFPSILLSAFLVDLHLGSRLTVGGQARFDLVSGTRFGAIRLGGAYVFGAARPVSESSERGGS